MMSVLTTAIRFNRGPSRIRPFGPVKAEAQSQSPSASPVYSAISVAHGHALHPPAEPQDEPDVERDVEPVHHQLQHKYGARALDGDQPAGEGIGRYGRGSAPDADVEIGTCQRLDLGARGRDAKGGPDERRLQRNQRQPRRARHQ
jgi:hypothetical protein